MREYSPQAALPRRQDFDLAFACSWWRPKAPTWSYTPSRLRSGLIEAGIVLRDVEAQPPLLLQAPVAAALTALGGRPWKYAPFYRRLEARRVRRAVESLRPQAVLEIADLAVPTSAPTYCYQDMNFAVALDHYDALGPNMISALPARREILRRLADEQNEAMQKLDGVLTMGRWYRDYLIRNGILPAHRVHAVGGGIDPIHCRATPRTVRPARERTRVLFVGGEFHRKGGDQVLDAVAQLNRSGDRPLRLTIAGPSSWPLPGAPPDWVDFRGTVPRAEVAQLFASHDLFVMPSRFEAYGMVFLEARAWGIPCIGRDAYAMPELIQPGIGGAVWEGGRVESLADLIQATLADDELHRRCAYDAAPFAAAQHWTRVAERIADRLGASPAPKAFHELSVN